MRCSALMPVPLLALAACTGGIGSAGDSREERVESVLAEVAPREAWVEGALALVDLDIATKGQGSVVLPDASSCTTRCSWAARAPATVELLATPEAGGEHVGWSGACAGQPARCVVTVAAAGTTTAIFAAAP